jgi:hypothetical protein
MIIPVITLWRPWSYLIYLNAVKSKEDKSEWKTIETRTHDRFKNLIHKTIGIHSGERWDNNWLELARSYLTNEQIQLIEKLKFNNQIPAGKVICTAYCHDYKYPLSSFYSKQALVPCWLDRAGLFLREIKSIDSPILKGERGIWYYDTINRCKVVKSKENNQLSIAV